MKRSLSLLSIFMLIAIGCSKPETRLAGKWKSAEIKGFEAEFKADHTGATSTPIQGHGGATTESTKLPFQWSIEKDGRIKITEDKTTYYGKFVGKKLEIEVNDAKSILEKVK